MRKFRNILFLFVFLSVFLLLLLPYLSPVRAGNLFFISLAAVPLFVVNGFLFLVMLPKRNRWSWFLGALLLVSLSYMLHYVSFPCPASQGRQGTQPIRLISWNAEGFHLSSDTLAKVACYINGRHPDLLCFQERPHTSLLAWDSIQSAFPDYPYKIINSREDEVLNLALFSRWPIRNIKEYYFPDSYNKILQADIKMTGCTIRLFNVHLQTTGVAQDTQSSVLFQTLRSNTIKRNLQAEQLIKAIQKSPFPVIVCGDFNDVPSSYAYRNMARFMQDCFQKAGCGWGGSYQPWKGFFRIDYTFCSKEFGVDSYRLIKNSWSDHKMQESEIHISSYMDN